ncbi:MAG: 3-deoxy-7-phosphoheptulonate synthase [Lentisphaerae bacterium]|nr:3-deoxy-7-phosphoheptulonate synthase [Lentisphaerota bacterium]MCP4103077.1 3-deoxy-7-phosphoheptulonate synthase [Lentisphaerota bacterium]
MTLIFIIDSRRILINIELDKFSDWCGKVDKTFLIAGPCSAESECQVLSTIKALKGLDIKINYFRAGVWKPRTRPNSFEGVGVKGLKWLQGVREIYRTPVCVEVATTAHVEESLKHDIDALWLGARTTSNPIIMQEIANSLQGVDKPIFVKNPINPDIGLWVGAFERLNNSGVTKLSAIHRGFSTYNKNMHRNDPIWEMPMELKRILPRLPLLCDPSHISGNREMVFSVSQNALDFLFDGLMVEVHVDPKKAFTDREQQLGPRQLRDMLNKLTLKKNSINKPSYLTQIEILREEIDKCDKHLLDTLAKRSGISKKIGALKSKNKISIST